MTTTERKTGKYTIKAKTPRGAANEILRAIKREPGGANAFIRKADYFDKLWCVVWEEGPYEWAPIATGRGNIWDEENGLPLYCRTSTPTFDSLSTENWYCECENSYTLMLVPN